MKEWINKNRDSFNDLKDTVLGVFVLLIFLLLFIGTQLLGMSNPAYNAPSSKYKCSSPAVGTIECKPNHHLP